MRAVSRVTQVALLIGVLARPSLARAAPACDFGELQSCFPALLAAPPVFAWGGGPASPGIPRVIAWSDTTDSSGIAWGTTSQIANANVYLTGDPSNGLTLNVPSGGASFDFVVAGAGVLDINTLGEGTFTPIASTATSGRFYQFNGAADTSLLAGVPVAGVIFDFSPTLTWATGAIAGDQATVLIKAPTLAFAGSSTVSNAATLEIDKAPVVGANAIITNDYALWVKAGGESLTGGLALSSSSAPNGGIAYLNYDGTNLGLNAPTSKGFAFTVNGSNVFTVSANGQGTFTTSAVVTGGFMANSATSPGVSFAFFNYDGTNGIINVPTGKGFAFNVAGANELTVSNAGAGVFTGSVSAVGAILTSGTAPAASNAYLDYDGTNVIFNAPTGMDQLWKTNNATKMQLDNSNGRLILSSANWWFEATNVRVGDGSGQVTSIKSTTPSLTLRGAVADGATNVAIVLNNTTALSTAGAKILSVQNNAGEKFGFKWDSGLTFSTTIKPAAADYGISQDGSNLLFGAPTGKGFGFNVNGTSQATISSAGAITSLGSVTPTSGGTGAAALTQFLTQGYTIDFPAFTAGIDQTSAQAMTGVAFGDACSVGTGTDQTAAIGQLSVMVTSAGNIKIVASPVSTTSTANPASDTYTVKCVR